MQSPSLTDSGGLLSEGIPAGPPSPSADRELSDRAAQDTQTGLPGPLGFPAREALGWMGPCPGLVAMSRVHWDVRPLWRQ